jgi:hypothetical protein
LAAVAGFLTVGVLGVARFPAAAEPDPTLKLLTKRFKVASVDTAARRITVKEAGHEITYHAQKTKFFLHRSLPLKDLKESAALHVFGRLHEPVRDKDARSDPLITDVALVAGGTEFTPPALATASEFVDWHEGKLEKPAAPFQLRIGGERYRLTGDDKLAAYWVEKTTPESLAGAVVFIRGNAKKAIVERNGKQETVTRVFATQVHVLQLNAEHLKVFQLQWVERKKAPAGTGAAPDKGAADKAKGS